MANGLRSYIENMRSQGKPLYFTNTGQNPESWPTGEGDVFYRSEGDWNKETEAELSKPASGFDYSEDVGRKMPLLTEDQNKPGGPAAPAGSPAGPGKQPRGYHLSQAMNELQNHIPGIIQHTLNGKEKPTTDAERKAVTKNIQQFFNLLKSDIEKQNTAESSAMGTRGKEFKNYQGYSKEDKAAYERLYGKKGGNTDKFSFADKEQYKYLVGRLKELDEKLGGEFSDDLNEDERAKIQNDRKTILDGLTELERTSGAGENRGPGGGGLKRSSARGPGSQVSSSAPDKSAALKQVAESGASREDIQAYIQANPDASTQDFIDHFQRSAAPASEEAPDIKNTPVNTSVKTGNVSAGGIQQPQGLQRNKIPFNASMTASDTALQKQAAVQELTDLANKLGVGVGNWKALGELAKDMGGWAWESYQNAFNALVQGQDEARTQLQGYGN